MMLVWVLVMTVLLVSDVTGTENSLELERTQHHLEKRELSRGPCDENWFYYSLLNSCYRFFSEEKTWEAAEDFCDQKSYYGQLASVNSDEHNAFISEVVAAVEKNKPWAWIGLNDICMEGNFTWIDGTDYTYKDWDRGQPDDHDNEDCVHIHHGVNSPSKWNDYPCDEKLGFVCAYKFHSI
ncbi:alpha-N-acetylgalactosamine-specific lectin-like isoform X2 [Hypanus sabinus]|nr:alpha-N-acetylgalactosamine-specific lectin-like isoform X2 [Hypanus sabinus]XP_059842848.1 alpha-N-acetylgalactosamine-specific lectin-like isoform X2 [Hypanus sabinus]